MQTYKKNITVVNVYNFIRKSHEEPSRFIQDDFDTIKNQIEVLKQYQLPSTYALKHDALMDEKYQKLLFDNLDSYDEVGVWWEITGELCQRAGINFQGVSTEEFDNRVNTAYSIGYTVEERKLLIDAYMADFKEIFGYYPKTIASWVIDIVTLEYAREKYGVIGGGLCRDQIAIDGFTLWGGYVNGAFYPSRFNENIPAQTLENQVDMPLFRLLGPDPIYSFDAGLREGLFGVYSLEPCCPVGRDKEWITWMFERLTQEDTIGMNYTHVGQENNFLWENIKPGFEPQLKHIKKLAQEGKIRIETLAETAEWFRKKYKTTPPATYQASEDWNKKYDLKTTWYSCKNYRVSFLYDNHKLSIRDLFVYQEEYTSRYLKDTLKDAESTYDALPIMHPHLWKEKGLRPSIDLLDKRNMPIEGEVKFSTVDDKIAKVTFTTCSEEVIFELKEDQIIVTGDINLCITKIPVLKRALEKEIQMEYEGFPYHLVLLEGICQIKDGLLYLESQNKKLVLQLNQKSYETEIYTDKYKLCSKEIDQYESNYLKASQKERKLHKAIPPEILPLTQVKQIGEEQCFTISSAYEDGMIYYTLDGSNPDKNAFLYKEPILVSENTTLRACVYWQEFVSDIVESKVYFSKKIVAVESPTRFDPREIFNRKGAYDLIDEQRGSLDYQDKKWLGTLDHLDVTCTLECEEHIHKVTIGFLSHHRSGIVYPEYVELYAGIKKDQLTLVDKIEIPNQPGEKEIEKKDIIFSINQKANYIRVFAKNYEIQPYWCCLKGTRGVFIMTDSIIVE